MSVTEKYENRLYDDSGQPLETAKVVTSLSGCFFWGNIAHIVFELVNITTVFKIR